MFHCEPKIIKGNFARKDKSGHLLNPVVIDQFAGQPFQKNKFGWPASDVSILINSDRSAVADRVMSRLQLLRDDPNNKDKTDAELIRDLIPRSMQSYGELSAYMDWYKAKYGEPLFEPNPEPEKKDEPEPPADPAPES